MTWTLRKRFASYHPTDGAHPRVLADSMDRPEQSVHKGVEPRPLFCNPVPKMLARAIANHAFRDYSSMDELLEIEPPEDEMYHLRQHESVLDKPFVHVISNGEMEKADIFSRRLRELGIRAGYLRPPMYHPRLPGGGLVPHWYVFPLFSMHLNS